MSNELTVTKISWINVAKKVSEALGKPYTAAYVREVAVGYRANKNLTPILRDLGVMQGEVA